MALKKSEIYSSLWQSNDEVSGNMETERAQPEQRQANSYEANNESSRAYLLKAHAKFIPPSGSVDTDDVEEEPECE